MALPARYERDEGLVAHSDSGPRTSNGQMRRQTPLQVLEQYNQQASGSLVPK